MSGKILVFAGSARKGSFNKKLAAAAHRLAVEAGLEAALADLADYEAPVYNGDIEAGGGLPAPMREFRSLIASHDGLLIVTPEYNGHVPPLLVNTFSWASRPDGDDKSNVFAGKRVAIAAASPGGLGGVRVVPRLRDMVAELGAVAVPGFVTLPGAPDAFDGEGNLTAEAPKEALRGLVQRLAEAL